MGTKGICTLAALVTLIAGCGGSTSSSPDGSAPFDGGGADAQTPDTGASPDAGSPGVDAGHDAASVSGDAGGCSNDAGPSPGDCVLYVPVGSFGPLTNACYPRCTAATAAAYRACTTASCRGRAVMGDTTPGVSYYIGSAHITSPLDCQGCVSYQEFHCFSLVCPSQVNSYVDACIAGSDPTACDNAITDVDLCLGALSPSQEATVDACYASHDGPEACFPCGA